MAACQSGTNPIDQYEQKHPVTVAPPEAVQNPNYPPEKVAHGRYLVGLLGCGSCHTNGSLVGTPNLQQLLGGRVGSWVIGIQFETRVGDDDDLVVVVEERRFLDPAGFGAVDDGRERHLGPAPFGPEHEHN